MSVASDGREDVPPDIRTDQLPKENYVLKQVKMETEITKNQDDTTPSLIQKTQAITSQSNSILEKNDKPKPERLYEPTDLGPYFVFIESKTSEGAGIGRLHPMSIGKLLHNTCPEIYNNILNIYKIGKNRIKVETRLGEQANALVKSEKLKTKQVNVYIPYFTLEKKGVIRDVDIDLTDSEILDNLKTLYSDTQKVVNIRRFNKKIVNKDTNSIEYKPTRSVLVTFRGQLLPRYLSIHHVRCEVHPFVPTVIQCHSCLRYGHSTAQCKSTITRCKRCSEKHDTDICPPDTLLRCINCNGNHSPLAKELCSEYSKQKNIKEQMTNYNLTYMEAKAKIEGKSYSWITLRNTPDDFPTLEQSKNNLQSNSKNYIRNKISVVKRQRISSPQKENKNTELRENILKDFTVPLMPSKPIENNPYKEKKSSETAITLKKNDQLNILTEALFAVVNTILSSKNEKITENEIKNMIIDRTKNLSVPI